MAKRLEQQHTTGASLISGSDVIYDYICQSCNEDGKQLEAVGFCVDCSEFLCDECFKYHLKPKLTRHHKLLDIEEAKKDENLSGCLDICTEKCSQHRREVIKYFCSDHDCIGCGVCLNLDHRNCKGVQYIPKITKNKGNEEELSTMIKELDMIVLHTKELAQISLGNRLRSQVIYDKALDHVKQVKKGVKEVLNKLEKDIKIEADKMKKTDMLKMEESIKSCDNIQTKVQNLSINMKAMQMREQYCNLFVAMKTTKTEMRSIVKSLEDISNDNVIRDYLFLPTEQLHNFHKRGGSLGKLSIKDEIKTKGTKIGGISVEMHSDSETCNITGMVLVTSGRLAAVDNYNNKVKLIDTEQSKVIAEYQLPCDPWDITTTEETGEIAVTQPNNHEILLLRVSGDRLYKQKAIKATGMCIGIACIKDRFVVSITSPERLEIIDAQGNVLQNITKDLNGRPLFGSVHSIAVSQDTGTVYVPDSSKVTVTRLSLTGLVLGIYENRYLISVQCVTVAKGGVLYVCGENSNTIHQVTADCKDMRILLTKKDGLDEPRSMCYDDNTNCLYVGQLRKDTVLVFQIS